MRKSVRLKPKRDWGISTDATGLLSGAQVRRGGYSGQSALSHDEQETEAAIMSVAMSQPHRRGCSAPDPLDSSPLGRFCKRALPGDHNRRLREGRFWAGCDYAKEVDNDLVARGLVPRHYGRGETVSIAGMTDEELRVRREKVARALKRADEELIDVDGTKAVGIVRRVAHEDLEPGHSENGILFNCLYRLALYYGWEERPFHGVARRGEKRA
jgi:hypothetical protein